mmetsp:Transcript_5363/g.20351  ORF Transcript_5363/g.20351 Transcript_5363/m.20351 type:complete len:505 (-) Transcript_5363:2024-3538(-)
MELEAPAHLLAAGAQRDQHTGQGREAQQHAGRVGQALGPVVALVDQRQRLDGKHREHAGHQVEDQATEQREGQRGQQAELALRRGGRRRLGGSRGAEVGRAGTLAGAFGHRGRDGPGLFTRRRRQHEHAAQRLAGGQRLVARRQLQRPAATLCLEGLGRTVGDGAPGLGEEVSLGDCGGRAGKRDALGCRLEGDAEGRRLGNRSPPLIDLCNIRAGLGLRQRGDDRQIQPQADLFGNADILADQPLDVGAGLEAAAGPGIGRHGQLDEQGRPALVAVVDDRADGLDGRRWPLQRPGLGAAPVEAGRLTRIAGVFPVGVPMRLDGLLQRHREALACGHRSLAGHEAGLDMLGRRIGRHGPSHQGGGQQDGSEGAQQGQHAGILGQTGFTASGQPFGTNRRATAAPGPAVQFIRSRAARPNSARASTRCCRRLGHRGSRPAMRRRPAGGATGCWAGPSGAAWRNCRPTRRRQRRQRCSRRQTTGPSWTRAAWSAAAPNRHGASTRR